MGIPDTNIGTEKIGTSVSSTALAALAKQDALVRKALPSGISSIIEQQERTQRLCSSAMLGFAKSNHDHVSALAAIARDSTSVFEGIGANIALANPALGLSKSMQAITDTIAGATMSSAFACPALDLSKSLQPFANSMAVTMAAKSELFSNNFPQNRLTEIAQMISDSMPKFYNSEFLKVTESFAHGLGQMIDYIGETTRTYLPRLVNAISNIDLSKIDLATRNFERFHRFRERNSVLTRFDWFLVSELPEEIVEEIYERKDEITQEEVDTLIVQFFRENEYAALREIVAGWQELSYFKSREAGFHDAGEAHSHQLFNASISTIVPYFDGVATDFVREKTNGTDYGNRALTKVNDLAGHLPISAIPWAESIACIDVLEWIGNAFNYFSPVNPSDDSSLNRHRIAHGQVKRKETESNSLRCFLFMNVLYKLLYCLESRMEITVQA